MIERDASRVARPEEDGGLVGPHRRLALEAAEPGVSLDRLVGAKLAG